MGQPLATVAIISHERPILRDRAVESGLSSIARSGTALPVLLIDSSRTRRTAPVGVQLVHRPDKPMCVSKRRLAAELSDTEWVILLDDDCLVVPEAIGTLLAAMDNDDHRRTAALFVVTQFRGPQTKMFRAALHSDLTAGFGQSADGDISWGVTALAAFRRRALLSVDAFNGEELAVRVGGEDVDACIRLRAAGWRVRQLPPCSPCTTPRPGTHSQRMSAAPATMVRRRLNWSGCTLDTPVSVTESPGQYHFWRVVRAAGRRSGQDRDARRTGRLAGERTA